MPFLYCSHLLGPKALPKAGLIGGQKAIALSEARPGEGLRKRRRQSPHTGKAGQSPKNHRVEQSENLRRFLEEKIRKLEEVRRDLESMTEANRQELLVSLDNISAYGRKVDTVAELVTLTTSLGRIVKNAAKSLGRSGEELAKLNREMTHDLLDGPAGRIRDLSTKAVLKQTEDEVQSMPIGLAIGREIVDYFFKVQSPSFWAAAIAAYGEGASIGESLSESDPEEVIRKSLEKLESQNRRAMRNINRRIGKIRARLRAMGNR